VATVTPLRWVVVMLKIVGDVEKRRF